MQSLKFLTKAIAIFSISATCIVPNLAFAQNNSPKKTLTPVIISASSPTKGDTFFQPSQINVLGGEEKRIREKSSIAESLDHISGIDVISTGGQNSKPVIRGLSGERVKMVSNGVGVDHQQFDSRHAPNIDPFLSEKLEIIQGPASILYGSGAIGGAVNVQSLPLEFSDEKDFEFGGNSLVGYSSNNSQFDRGFKAKTRNNRWSLSAGAINRDGEEITTPEDHTFYPEEPPSAIHNSSPAYTGKLPFTDFEQKNHQFGIGFKNDENEHRVRYTKYYNNQNFLLSPESDGHGHGDDDDDDDGDHHDEDGAEGAHQILENDELQIASKFKINNNFDFKPTLTWQNNRRKESHHDETIDVRFDLYTARLITEHKKLGIFDGGKIGFEISHKDQESRGSEQLSPGGSVNNYALFAFEEKQINKLKLQAGLRHDWRDLTANENKTTNPENFSGSQKEEFSAFSGSLGAAYEINKNLVAATNVSRGFRAPTLFELYSGGTHTGISAIQEGNPNLEEEISLNTDFSLRYRSKGTKFGATYYRNKINNFIYLNDTGREQDNLHIFEVMQTDGVIEGLEIEASTFLTKRIEARATIDIIESENKRTGQDLPQIPSNEFRLETTYYAPSFNKFENPYFRVGVTYNSSKKAATGEPFSQFDNEDFGTGSTDNYTLLDLATGFELNFNGNLIKRSYLDFEITNLTNESYRNFLDTYKGVALSQGRNIMLKLRVPFGFESN